MRPGLCQDVGAGGRGGTEEGNEEVKELRGQGLGLVFQWLLKSHSVVTGLP